MSKYSAQARRIRLLQDDTKLFEDKQFAAYLGLRQPNMSNILRGERLGLESLMQICKKLNACPWWIWTGEGDQYRSDSREPLTLNEVWVSVQGLPVSERLEVAVRILESLVPHELGSE